MSDGIWMISYAVETETGNGSVFDYYPSEDEGYFLTREGAEARLVVLHEEEAAAHRRRFEKGSLFGYNQRKADQEQITKQNTVLKEAGLPLLSTRWVGDEPEYKGWHKGMSSYDIIEVKPGKVR